MSAIVKDMLGLKNTGTIAGILDRLKIILRD